MCWYFLRSRNTVVAFTTRKEAIGPPQKYQDQDDPVLILALVPVQLCSGTFDVYENVQRSFTGW